MNNEEIYAKQRDILFEVCKKIATNDKCPKWIVDIIIPAVKNAKNLKNEISKEEINSVFNDVIVDNTPIKINDIVISTVKNDNCVYKVIEEADIVQNIQLFNLSIIKGDNNNPEGFIVHNVPQSLLRKKV